MGLYRVQYADGPIEEIPALSAEEAWDTYKVRNGKRRDVLAEQRGELQPPLLEELPEPEPKPVARKRSARLS